MGRIIHCVGDSHVSIFNGYDTPSETIRGVTGVDMLSEFRTYRMGPLLAWSLGNIDGRQHAEVYNFIRDLPKTDSLLLSFGEIDCRMHLVYQSELQNRSLEDITTECVERYFNTFVMRVKSFNFANVICFGPVPSTEMDSRRGTKEQRNQSCKLFNDILQELCDKNGVIFWSIFNNLINENWSAKAQFSYDGIHYRSICLKFLKNDMMNLGIDFDKTINEIRVKTGLESI